MPIRPGPHHAGVRARILSLAAGAALASASCTSHDTPATDTTAAHAAAPSDAAATAAGTAITPVRGTITAMSDTSITVATATGDQQIRLVAPVHVYTRASSDLAHVTPNAFVGITSVPQPGGSQRATEIHIFPEELRGTGEGSRLMAQAAGTTGPPSTMTNGAVSSPSQMTNGSVSGAGSRMTNGTVGAKGGGTSYTVQYQGGTQQIAVPANVEVTAISPTQTKLAVGNIVVVLARTGPGGRSSASAVMLAGPTPVK